VEELAVGIKVKPIRADDSIAKGIYAAAESLSKSPRKELVPLSLLVGGRRLGRRPVTYLLQVLSFGGLLMQVLFKIAFVFVFGLLS
jgi:hypothetical protein